MTDPGQITNFTGYRWPVLKSIRHHSWNRLRDISFSGNYPKSLKRKRPSGNGRLFSSSADYIRKGIIPAIPAEEKAERNS
jgi:hypothetical protein